MVAKLRLLAAFGALFMAALVVWQSAPPATVGGPKVELRSNRRSDGPAHNDEEPDRGVPPTRARSTRVGTFRLTWSSG